MWRVAPADRKVVVRCPGTQGRRLLSSTYAVAAAALLLTGCAGAGAPTSDVSQASATATSARTPGASPPAHSSPAAQKATATSSIAPFTLPAAVSRPTVYAAGDGLLIVGGLTAADTTTRALLRVDLGAGTVSPAGSLAVPVHDAAGAAVNGRDLLFGGGSTAVSSAVQDVTPGGSPRVISHLPQPRADLVAISDGKAGYVLGGFDGTHGSTTILRTRDGRTFDVVGTLPVSVRYPAVAATPGSIWVFGGEHAGSQVSDVQRIDLATGHGSVAGHLPGPLAHAGAFTLGGAVFVAGGRIGPTATEAVLRFDPATVRFTPAGHLPAARSDFGVAVVGGAAYLVGGENPKPVNTVIVVRARSAAPS